MTYASLIRWFRIRLIERQIGQLYGYVYRTRAYAGPLLQDMNTCSQGESYAPMKQSKAREANDGGSGASSLAYGTLRRLKTFDGLRCWLPQFLFRQAPFRGVDTLFYAIIDRLRALP